MAKTKFENFKEYLLKGDIEGVTNYLEKDFLEKIIDDFFEYRPIHIACDKGYIDIVKMLIDRKCNIESETIYKYRPIHFACLTGQIEILNLLIEQKCQIEPTTKYGETPLEWAKSFHHTDIVKLIEEALKVKNKIRDSIINNDDESFATLYSPAILTTMDEISGKCWLEMALEKGANRIINYFLDRPIDVSEVNYIEKIIESDSRNSISAELWKEIILFKCIRDHNEEGFQIVCSANVINAQHKIITSSFLEVAVEHGSYIFVLEILKKSIFESETWKKAKKIALEKGHHLIKELIISRECLLRHRQKAKLSILHTAVCDNDPDMVEYILDRSLVDPNDNHETLGTPLALAILLCYENCVAVLERFNVDCNTQNKFLQSPLMEAISNGMIESCRNLIDRATNINEAGLMGQTVLHCAVMGGYEDLCDQLIKRGADCCRYMGFLQRSQIKDHRALSQRENSLTLCMKIHKNIYPCFLDDLDITKANSSDYEGNSLLHFSIDLLNTQLCDTLIHTGASVDSKNKQGHTPLSELLLKLDKQTFDDADEKVKEKIKILLKSLLIHANNDAKQSMVERVLYHLAKFEDKDSFESLLNIEILNPRWLANGETLFTGILKEMKSIFMQKLIQSKTNNKKYMNFKNRTNQTPLQVAIETESMGAVQHLIFETKDLDNEDSEGRTALMQLFMKIATYQDENRDFELLNAIRTIILRGGNIYHKTWDGIKIIEFCNGLETRREIESFFQSSQQKTIVEFLEVEKIVEVERMVDNTCEICMDRKVDSVFDCGHTLCRICSEEIVRCPFCGFEPARARRLYLS